MLVALLIIAYVYGAAILTSNIKDVKTAQLAFAAAIWLPILFCIFAIVIDLLV